MGSSKIKTQSQSQGHVTIAFICFSKGKKTNNKNITEQHLLLDLVFRCVYMSIVNNFYKQIHIEGFF